MLKGALLKLRNQPALEPSKTPALLLFARSASPLMRERRINWVSLCTNRPILARRAREGLANQTTRDYEDYCSESLMIA